MILVDDFWCFFFSGQHPLRARILAKPEDFGMMESISPFLGKGLGAYTPASKRLWHSALGYVTCISRPQLNAGYTHIAGWLWTQYWLMIDELCTYMYILKFVLLNNYWKRPGFLFVPLRHPLFICQCHRCSPDIWDRSARSFPDRITERTMRSVATDDS